jgi:hypothetical protein
MLYYENSVIPVYSEFIDGLEEVRMKRAISVFLCITFIFCGTALYGSDAAKTRDINEFIAMCRNFLTAIQDMTSKMDIARASRKASDVLELFTRFQRLHTKFQSDFSALQKKYEDILSEDDVISSPDLESIVDAVLEAMAAFYSAYIGKSE